MRPYLAIIKDSFREALASRVLYIMLGLISVLLLLAAPLTFRQELTIGLHDDDAQWPDLIDQLKLMEKETKTTPARRVWLLMNVEQKKKIRDLKRPPKRPSVREAFDYQRDLQEIAQAVDEVSRNPDLYDRDAWSGVSLNSEGRRLVAQGVDKLEEQEKLRLNRILVEAAFPGLVRTSPKTSFQLNLAGVRDVWDPLPMSKSDFRAMVAALMPFLIDKILLGIGLLIAILITAPVMPQTFDPGSLHLLLSKPIGRSLLYLTKFAGGCAFVVLCASYLFVGLWFVAGTRWGIWESRILLCIPIYTFVFATYYSVASLAGALWRNAIVSIIVAAIFWCICFFVGWAKIVLEVTINSSRLSTLEIAGEDVIALTPSRTPQIWDSSQNAWKTTFQTDEQRDLGMIGALASGRNVGPIYDPKNKQLVGVTMSLSNGQMMLMGGKKEQDWKPIEGAPAPISSVALLHEPDGTPVLVTNYSLHRITGPITPPQDKVKFLGYTLPSLKGSALAEAGPRPAQSWGPRMAIALDQTSGLLVVYDGGEFTTLALRNGHYEQQAKNRIWESDRGRPLLAAGGGTILLARASGQIVLFDEKTLKELETLDHSEAKSRPIAAAAAPSGKWFAVLFQNRRLWIYNAVEKKLQLAGVTGQGDVSAVAFAQDDRLYVADRTDRISEYSAADLHVQRRLAPTMSVQDQFFRYIVMPIYTVCPKPGEFYKTISYVLSDSAKKSKDNAENGEEVRADDEAAPEDSHPWSPVWSSAIFMAVMLAIGCAYMQWQEF